MDWRQKQTKTANQKKKKNHFKRNQNQTARPQIQEQQNCEAPGKSADPLEKYLHGSQTNDRPKKKNTVTSNATKMTQLDNINHKSKLARNQANQLIYCRKNLTKVANQLDQKKKKEEKRHPKTERKQASTTPTKKKPTTQQTKCEQSKRREQHAKRQSGRSEEKTREQEKSKNNCETIQSSFAVCLIKPLIDIQPQSKQAKTTSQNNLKGNDQIQQKRNHGRSHMSANAICTPDCTEQLKPPPPLKTKNSNISKQKQGK